MCDLVIIRHTGKLRLKRIATVILFVEFERFQLSIPNTQYWFNTGPNIGPNYKPTAVQAKRQYLLTCKVSRNCLVPYKSIVIQKVLD